MSTPKAIERRRQRENKRRKAERKVKRLDRLESSKEANAWLAAHLKRLEKARDLGSKRVAKRFGKTARQRLNARERQVEAEGRSKAWEMDYITRLLTPAKPRLISTIDGEWIPPSKWHKHGKGKSQRHISDPIEARMFGRFDGREYVRYESIADLLEKELTDENSGRWYFAHSGGRADFLFLVEEFLKQKESTDTNKLVLKVDEKLAGGRIVFVNLSKGRWIVQRDRYGRPKLTKDDAGNTVPKRKWHTKSNWSFIDSTRIFQSSLADIGRTVGLEKAQDAKTIAYLKQRFVDTGLETGTDLEKYSRNNKRLFYTEAPLDVLEEYNRRDTEILWHALDQYQVTLLELGGQMQRTGAACSLDLFRRAYLSKDIRTDQEINSIVEAGNAYVASRVEPFRLRFDAGDTDQRIYRHDINSSFPASTLRPMPAELELEERGPLDVEKFKKRFGLKDRDRQTNPIVLAYLSISVPATNTKGEPWPHSFVPPLPVRTGHHLSNGEFVGENIFFPTGSWRGFFLTPDIELLLQYGGDITAVHGVWTFEPFTDLKRYSTDLFKLRLEAQKRGLKAREQSIKLWLNSLYGKWAEKTIKQEFRLDPSADEIKKWRGEKITDDRNSPANPFFIPGEDEPERLPITTGGISLKFGNLWTLEKQVRIPHRHVILSAYQTSDARARLTRYLWDAIDKSGEVYYTDTDSCDVTVQLPVGRQLGELKPEAVVKKANYVQPKLYRLEGWEVKDDKNGPPNWNNLKEFTKRKHKGFRDVDPNEFDEELLTGANIEQQRMLGQAELLSFFEDEQERLKAKGMTLEFSKAPREFRFKKHLSWAQVPKRCLLDDKGHPIKTALKREWTKEEIRKAKRTRYGFTRPWTVEELKAQGQAGIREGRATVPQPSSSTARDFDQDLLLEY
jgi:hypothetical protein